jgi:CheY-like chemotaxis protein
MARILVVDDEPPIRDLLTEFLADEGHTVLTAVDGLAALDLLAEQAVDLVVTDAMMPRVDGPNLVRRMRDDPRTRGIAVILMSAVVIPNSAVLAGVAVVAKPFGLDEFLGAIERALGPWRDP